MSYDTLPDNADYENVQEVQVEEFVNGEPN